MANTTSLNVLLVTEGSGGHLIPALEVAARLARQGARVKLWYARRRRVAALAGAWAGAEGQRAVDMDELPVPESRRMLSRLWHCGHLWSRSERCFKTFPPDVVVGFGGWVSAPVLLAARRRHIGCLVHEQNVRLGRANQWLAPWMQGVAVSFPQTREALHGARAVITGMPVRETIGCATKAESARRFQLDPKLPTLLVLGGSQGSAALNTLMMRVAEQMTAAERARWQILHVAGTEDAPRVRAAYAEHGVRAHVAAFVVEIEAAYGAADALLARAGASTIAELARCGLPAVLIPYPYAGAHQVANAQAVEAAGGGVAIEEREASPERVLATLRRLLGDARLRAMMGTQVRQLAVPDAAERLAEAIRRVGSRDGH